MKKLMVVCLTIVVLLFGLSSVSFASTAFTPEEETLLANYVAELESDLQKATIQRDAYKTAYEALDDLTTDYAKMIQKMSENYDALVVSLTARITLLEEKIALSEEKVEVIESANKQLKGQLGVSKSLNVLLSILAVALLL